MSKKVSDTQRIIGFGMAADEPTLNAAIESLAAIRSNRFPKTRTLGKPPKARSDKGKPRGEQTELPGTQDVAGQS